MTLATATHRTAAAPRPGQPTGADLDETLELLGTAMRTLNGLRSLVHTHSTRPVLAVDETAVEYLLEERDNLIGAVDDALISYARAADPGGALLQLVAEAIEGEE